MRGMRWSLDEHPGSGLRAVFWGECRLDVRSDMGAQDSVLGEKWCRRRRVPRGC